MSPARIHARDLPKGVLDSALKAGQRRPDQEVTARRPAKPAPPRPGEVPRWRCTTCHSMFTAWAAAETHADDARHRRLELLW